MARLEKDFQSEMPKSLKAYFKNKPYIYYKYPDTGYGKKPYDFYVRFDSKHYAIELKRSIQKNGINFRELFKNREHELKSLEMEMICGFRAVVIVNVYLGRNHNKAYAFDIGNVSLWYAIGKQISFEELNQCIEIPKIRIPIPFSEKRTEGVWDMSKVFENF